MDIGSVKNSVNSTLAGVSSNGAADPRQKPGVSAETASKVVDEQAKARALEAAKPASREEVEDAVATIQDFVQSVHRSINFAVDDGSGRVVVKVTDAGSGDVIRQIPSEEALSLAENLSEVRSLLFKAEA